jgi:hypothetical protein
MKQKVVLEIKEFVVKVLLLCTYYENIRPETNNTDFSRGLHFQATILGPNQYFM